MSPLLQRLSKELEVEADPTRCAELLAHVAGYLAREGNFAESKSCIQRLRKDFGDGKSGRATVLIMWSEAMLHLYSELSPAALDRLTRSQALALAMRYRPGIALASAWKAHVEFELSAFESMMRSLEIALNHVQSQDVDANTRLAIVLSNSHMICGDRASAQVWFKKGHEWAYRNGDQASIEALLYNRTAFGIANLRASQCLGIDFDFDPKIVRKEIESSINLGQLVGIESLTNHTKLWSARLSIVEARFEQAIEELSSARHSSPFAGYNFSQQMIDLEIAYCLARLGRMEESRVLLASVQMTGFDELDIDEQLAIAWYRHELDAMLSLGRDSMSRLEYLDDIRNAYTESRRNLQLKLKALGVH